VSLLFTHKLHVVYAELFNLSIKRSFGNCGSGIIQGLKEDLFQPHTEPKTCYFCNKEFEAHTQEERDNCLKKFVDRSVNL